MHPFMVLVELFVPFLLQSLEFFYLGGGEDGADLPGHPGALDCQVSLDSGKFCRLGADCRFIDLVRLDERPEIAPFSDHSGHDRFHLPSLLLEDLLDLRLLMIGQPQLGSQFFQEVMTGLMAVMMRVPIMVALFLPVGAILSL